MWSGHVCQTVKWRHKKLFLSKKSPIYGPAMDDFDEAVLKEGRMTDDFEPNFELGISSNTGTPDIKSDNQSEVVFDASLQDSNKPTGSAPSITEMNDESRGRLTLRLKKKLCKMIAVSWEVSVPSGRVVKDRAVSSEYPDFNILRRKRELMRFGKNIRNTREKICLDLSITISKRILKRLGLSGPLFSFYFSEFSFIWPVFSLGVPNWFADPR